MEIDDKLKAKMLDIAVKSIPREMCGLLIKSSATGEMTFKEVPNTHPDPFNYFRIDARVIASVSIGGDSVTAFVHSHPDGAADPSANDVADMNMHGKPFVIVSARDREVKVWRPTTVPLVGRSYIHGKQDCYTIVQDYYQRELGITLPDFERSEHWWENAEGAALYADNFRAAGFVQVDVSDLRRDDVMLCYWGSTQHVNHAMIYLGSDGALKSEETTPCIGTRLFLHHPYNGLSARPILSQSRLDSCAFILRHRDLL